MQAFCNSPEDGESVRAAGNPCRVDLLSNAESSQPAIDTITRCTTWETGTHSASVACWTASAEAIECCGHGLLSCASVWLGRWNSHGILTTADSQIQCRRLLNRVWLGFTTIELSAEPSPNWLAQHLNITVDHTAVTPAEAGYIVAELPKDTQLTLVQAPNTVLSKHTRRALIVTCRASANRSAAGEAFQFRYFAPQYGVTEDPATGSAMRVLMRYWHNRGLFEGSPATLDRPVKALQCSATGGILYGALENSRIWVGGHVTELTEAAPT